MCDHDFDELAGYPCTFMDILRSVPAEDWAYMVLAAAITLACCVVILKVWG